MSKNSKAYREAAEKMDRDNLYTPLEAAKLAKETSSKKQDATVEVAIRLGVDPRKADQMVRGTVNLPHGTGKTARVIVFAVGDKAEEAMAAGADEVGSDDLIEKIQGGFLDFDAAIATPDQMAKVGRIARILGPRGLMPNPKTGTVTPDVAKAVNDIKGGKINFRVDKQANLHFVIGKASFDEKALAENYGAALDEILRAKPSSSKGRYLKKIVVSTTTGPGIPVDPSVTATSPRPDLAECELIAHFSPICAQQVHARCCVVGYRYGTSSRCRVPTPRPMRVSSTSVSVIPDAVVDLRYATADNFVGTPLYPAGRALPGARVAGARARRGRRRVSGPWGEAGVLGLLSPARRAGARCSTRCPTRTGWRGRGRLRAATSRAARST